MEFVISDIYCIVRMLYNYSLVLLTVGGVFVLILLLGLGCVHFLTNGILAVLNRNMRRVEIPNALANLCVCCTM
jgi:hypothetical protein